MEAPVQSKRREKTSRNKRKAQQKRDARGTEQIEVHGIWEKGWVLTSPLYVEEEKKDSWKGTTTTTKAEVKRMMEQINKAKGGVMPFA